MLMPMVLFFSASSSGLVTFAGAVANCLDQGITTATFVDATVDPSYQSTRCTFTGVPLAVFATGYLTTSDPINVRILRNLFKNLATFGFLSRLSTDPIVIASGNSLPPIFLVVEGNTIKEGAMHVGGVFPKHSRVVLRNNTILRLTSDGALICPLNALPAPSFTVCSNQVLAAALLLTPELIALENATIRIQRCVLRIHTSGVYHPIALMMRAIRALGPAAQILIEDNYLWASGMTYAQPHCSHAQDEGSILVAGAATTTIAGIEASVSSEAGPAYGTSSSAQVTQVSFSRNQCVLVTTADSAWFRSLSWTGTTLIVSNTAPINSSPDVVALFRFQHNTFTSTFIDSRLALVTFKEIRLDGSAAEAYLTHNTLRSTTTNTAATSLHPYDIMFSTHPDTGSVHLFGTARLVILRNTADLTPTSTTIRLISFKECTVHDAASIVVAANTIFSSGTHAVPSPTPLFLGFLVFQTLTLNITTPAPHNRRAALTDAQLSAILDSDGGPLAAGAVRTGADMAGLLLTGNKIRSASAVDIGMVEVNTLTVVVGSRSTNAIGYCGNADVAHGNAHVETMKGGGGAHAPLLWSACTASVSRALSPSQSLHSETMSETDTVSRYQTFSQVVSKSGTRANHSSSPSTTESKSLRADTPSSNTSNTRSMSATVSGNGTSGSVSALFSGSQTLVPLPEPPALIPLTTGFAATPFTPRYMHYAPRRLTGILSGLPLLLADDYAGLFAQRFQVPAAAGRQVRFRRARSPAQSSADSFQVRLAVAKTSAAAVDIAVSFAGQGAAASQTISLFASLTQPSVQPPLNATSADFTCGQLMCAQQSVLFPTGPRNSLEGPLGASDTSVIVSASVAALYAPRCDAAAPALAGIVYSTVPFTSEALLYYALPLTPTAAAAAASLNESEVLAQVRAHGAWRGGGASPLFVSGIETLALVGDPANPGPRAPFTIQQRALALVYPTGGPSPPIAPATAPSLAIGPSTTDAVWCTLAELQSYKARRLARGGSLGLPAVPTQCFAFATVEALHTACDADAACVGFSTVPMPLLPAEVAMASAASLAPHQTAPVVLVERPLCLYKAGPAGRDVWDYDRVYFEKPAQDPPRCRAVVERSGSIAVYVQQTSLATGFSVAVSVGGRTVATCGRDRPFANSFGGLDGVCGVAALCYAGPAATGAAVEVALVRDPQTHAHSSGCANTLGVLIEQTAVDTVPVPLLTEAPIERPAGAELLPSRPLRVTAASSSLLLATVPSQLPIRVFVHGAVTLALAVTQNHYACPANSPACAARTAPYVIEMATEAPPATSSSRASSVASYVSGGCQRCGGQRGFFRDSRPGRLGECGTELFCDDYMGAAANAVGAVVSATSCLDRSALIRNATQTTGSAPYSGLVTVTVDLASLAFAADGGGDCSASGFIGTLFARPQTTSGPPVFPLVAPDGTFATLLAVPPSTAAGAVARGLEFVAQGPVTAPFGNASLSWVTVLRPGRLLAVGPAAAPLFDAVYVDWFAGQPPNASPTLAAAPHPSGNGTWQTHLHPNSSYACLVDHTAGGAARCVFPVPRGATKVRVSAAQIDFLQATMTVRLDTGGTYIPAATTASVQCGGSPRRKFQAAPGEEGQCGTFRTCTEQFLYARDVDAERADRTTVTVDFSAGMTSRGGCALTAAVLVEFSRPPPADAAALAASCAVSPSSATPSGAVVDAPFECPGERRCIRREQLCDQVQDCARGDDEDRCYDLHRLLPSERFCKTAAHPSLAIPVPAAATTDACRRAMVALGGLAFTINSSATAGAPTPAAGLGYCTVVNGTAKEAIPADPQAFWCPPAADPAPVTTYMFLESGPDSFRQCHAGIHCNHRGTARAGTQPPCVCDCFLGYEGAGCAQQLRLEAVTHVAVTIGIPRLADSQRLISRPLFASLLTLASTTVDIGCPVLVPGDVTALPTISTAVTVVLWCTVESRTGNSRESEQHGTSLLLPATQARLRETLAAQAPLLTLVSLSIRGPMHALVPVAASCNVSAGGAGSATVLAGECAFRMPPAGRLGGRAFPDRLRVAFTRNVSVVAASGTIRLTASTSASTNRRVVVGTAPLACEPAPTSGTGGCVVSSCEVDLTRLTAGAYIDTEVSFVLENATLSPPTLFTAACDTPGVALAYYTRIGDVPTATNATALNTDADYARFFVGGVLVFVGGFFLFTAVAIGCCQRYRYQLRTLHAKHAPSLSDTVSSPPPSATAAAVGLVVTLLVKMKHFSDTSRLRRTRTDRWASALAIVGTACGILAAFLVLFYTTSFDIESSFGVVYEEYADAQCHRSPTSGMPRRLIAVPPATYACTRVSAIGEVVGATYARALCSGDDGHYTVRAAFGASASHCRAQPEVRVDGDACLPLTALYGPGARPGFVMLRCTTAAKAAARSDTLAALTTSVDVMTPAPVTAARVVGPAPVPTPSAGAWAYLVGGQLEWSLAAEPGAVDVVGPAPAPPGGAASARWLLQSSACTFAAANDSTGSGGCMGGVLAAFAPFLQTPGLLARLPTETPWTPTEAAAAKPLGFLFGYYGSSRAVGWTGAAATAHRYYNASGSPFDMGRHFPSPSAPSASLLSSSSSSSGQRAPVDGEGYTISMYLRAGPATLGFAYAVTDAFENADTAVVYPLDRLATIIENGLGAGAWFNTSGYSVYHSLYVNGPGTALVVAYAGPDSSSSSSAPNRVVLLEFDLAAIGMAHVLNDLWHHVAVVFRVENGKVLAQLVLDGETSYTQKGWSVCVPSLPRAVASPADLGARTVMPTSTPAAVSAPVFNVLKDKVTAGGLLVTGYFNGGVALLRAEPREVSETELLQRGTPAMRQRHAFPAAGVLALGSALISAAVLLAVFIVVTSMRECLAGDTTAAPKAVNLPEDASSATETPSPAKYLALEEEATPDGEDPERGRCSSAQAVTAASTPPEPLSAAANLVDRRYRHLLGVGLRSLTALNASGAVHEGPPLADVVAWILKGTVRRLRDVTDLEAILDDLRRQSPTEDNAGQSLVRLVLNAASLHHGTTPCPPSQGASAGDLCEEWSSLMREQRGRQSVMELSDEHKHDDGGCATPRAPVAVASAKGTSPAAAARPFPSTNTNVAGPSTAYRQNQQLYQTPAAQPAAGNDVNASSSSSGSPSLSVSVASVVGPAVAALQGVYVWGTAMHIPEGYMGALRGFFSFVSLDLSITVAALPAIVTPLLMVFLSLLVLGLFVHFMLEDNRRFEKRLVQTALKQHTERLSQALGQPTPADEQNTAPPEAADVAALLAPDLQDGAFLDVVASTQHGSQDEIINSPTREYPDQTTHHNHDLLEDDGKARPTLPPQVCSPSHAETQHECPGLLQDTLSEGTGITSSVLRMVLEPSATEVTTTVSPTADRRVAEAMTRRFTRENQDHDGPVAVENSFDPDRIRRRSVPPNCWADQPEACSLPAVAAESCKDTLANATGPAVDTKITKPTLIRRRAPTALALREGRVYHGAVLPAALMAALLDDADKPQKTTASDQHTGTVAGASRQHRGGDVAKRRNEAEENPDDVDIQQPDCKPLHEVVVLPLLVAHRIRHLGTVLQTTSAADEDDEEDENYIRPEEDEEVEMEAAHSDTLVERRVILSNNDGLQLLVTVQGAHLLKQQARAGAASNNDVDEPRKTAFEAECRPLCRVGAFCRVHPSVRLSPQRQTTLWPYHDPPSCGVVTEGGHRCGRSTGLIYRCGCQHLRVAGGGNKSSSNTSDASIVKTRCDYAVCSDHMRLSFAELLLARAAGARQQVLLEGWGWVACVLLATAAGLLYTPVVKTALMILACHPYYQCEFASCWQRSGRGMDQKFTLAAFLALVTVALFGAGLPLAMIYFLYRRRWQMRTILVNAGAEPATVVPNEHNHAVTASEQPAREDTSKNGKDSGPTEHTSMVSPPPPSAIITTQTSPHAASDEAWRMLVETDTSALAQQYRPVSAQWMFYAGVVLGFKLLRLLPALFFEPRSLTQGVGVAAVEALFAAIVFAATTHLSGYARASIRLACVHQLLLLGLLNLRNVLEQPAGVTSSGSGSSLSAAAEAAALVNATAAATATGPLAMADASAGTAIAPRILAALMLAVTIFYLCAVAAMIAAAVLWPVAEQQLRQRRLRRAMERLGFCYSPSVPLVVDPYHARHFFSPDKRIG